MLEPTAGQIDGYQRDGFLIVERFLDPSDLDLIRERFARVFEHEWETGLAPDEVNYVPGVTAPELTRQLCNVWKADRVLAGVTLSRQVGEFTARLAGLPGVRLAQDNAIWKPPSGKALLCHQDAAYLDHLNPPNMTTVAPTWRSGRRSYAGIEPEPNGMRSGVTPYAVRIALRNRCRAAGRRGSVGDRKNSAARS